MRNRALKESPKPEWPCFPRFFAALFVIAGLTVLIGVLA